MASKILTGAENVRWDLSFLYKGTDDPALEADISAWCDLARAFHETHKGKLATTLGQAIEDQAALGMLSNKLMVYLYLRLSCDTGDNPVKAKIADAEKRMSLASADWLNFFDHELVALEDAAIASLAASDPRVKKHLPWIEHARVFKPHLLKEEIEAALTKRGPFGAGSWSEYFDEYESDLRFPWKDEQLSLTEILKVLTDDPDAAVRADALKAINDGFAGHFAKYSAQTLYVIAGAKEIEDRERGYKHPMEARNKSSRIPDAVVETLHKAVVEGAGPLARRYYRLKAKLLGLETLKWSDRNAPMPFADTSTVPWDKAVATVLSAYESFSPTLAGLIRKTIEAKRIDAPGVKGKRGGAFNYSICVPGGVPVSFTFLNYLGSNGDVMTLAHELGHGVHGLLAGEAQGELMMHAPTAYAETASVFGEMTTFNYLKDGLAKKGDDQALLALLMDKMDDIMNTVVRQIGFSNFERRLHGAKAKLSVEELDAIWLETVHELYGKPGEVFTYENTEHLWAYISHFHRPFYVYGYAFGELLTQSLYAQRERLGERFEPLYLDLLRTGGTQDVSALLKPFGLDPTDPGFWIAGIEVSIGRMIDEAEALARKMGKIG
ncbi:MAG TPA: M3 family oligoendopeptidase [Candidatus Binatia bacterium]|nr:M3 family oligoendopeptidase [Candidatus Binatia bacterium]